MTRKEHIGIGLMGLGVVGSGVARILLKKEQALAQQVGCPLRLQRILVRHAEKERPQEIPRHLLTTQPLDLLHDPDIDILVEVMGGETPAYEYIQQGIRQGKHIVTANKEVIAKHGPELLALADQHRVGIAYEASVGGGIPLIAPFQQDLLANEITSLHAIINGTTNYILTRMAKEGIDFSAALAEAQALGYAEANPTQDIEGIDAAYKLAILASLAFHTPVRPQDVYHEGISRLTARDFRYARELGYAIKLLAIAKAEDNAIQVRVHPVFLSEDFLLAKVEGVYNAVELEADLVGRVLFYGRGAGALPTSSAVVADLISIGRALSSGTTPRLPVRWERPRTIRPMAQIQSRYYVRMSVADRPGVLAQIATVFGDFHISIASVIQKETDESAKTAEIVIMTHLSLESAMQEALREVARLEVVSEIGNFVRVED